MILLRGSNHGSTSNSGGRGIILVTLSLLLLVVDTSYAWRCSRCSRDESGSSPGEPYEGNTSSNCQECLDNGEVECLDYLVGYELYTDLPYYDFCQWKSDNGDPLESSSGEDNIFRGCSDWIEYGEEIKMDFVSELNSQFEGFCTYNPLSEFKCYPCEERCTKLYTCGDTSYACNHLFDMTVIQFNADEGSECRSILPLDLESELEYCGEQDVQGFTSDCGGLCDLEENELEGYICPNGQPIDSYWTICSDQNAGGYAKPLGFPLELDLFNLLKEAEAIIGGGFEFEYFWHYSCVDFGDVTCELTDVDTIPPSKKNGKSKSKGKGGDSAKKKGKSSKKTKSKSPKGTTKKSSKGETKKTGDKDPKMNDEKRALRKIRGN